MHTTLRSAAIAAAVLLAQTASAHEYSAQIRAKKYPEVEKAVAAKLAAEPNNPDALAAKIQLILIEGNDKRIDEGVKLAEQCVNANPKVSFCHEMRGNIMGIKAQKAGIFSAMGYVGTIKDSFKKAVELDPNNFNARNSMLQFYLQAPSIAGGGDGKAKEFIQETTKFNATSGALLQATMDLRDKEFQRATAAALSINPHGDETLILQQRNLLTSIGHSLVAEKKYAEAEKIFHEVMNRFPDSAMGYFGLGKTLQESGRAKDAIPLLEKANAIELSAAGWYRLGKSWQALADKPKAVAALEKSLAFKPDMAKSAREDAEDQLKALRK